MAFHTLQDGNILSLCEKLGHRHCVLLVYPIKEEIKCVSVSISCRDGLFLFFIIICDNMLHSYITGNTGFRSKTASKPRSTRQEMSVSPD